MGPSFDGKERRESFRILKNYNLIYYFKDSTERMTDVTIIKDISKGGVHFTTSKLIKPGTHLYFEIAISYIAPKKLKLEGEVISCEESSTRTVFEIRAHFIGMDEETSQLFDMIEKRNLKGH